MIPGLINKIAGRAKYKKEENAEPPFKDAKSIEDKIKEIVRARRIEVYHDDMARARVYYRVALLYRGYHNLGPWDEVRWSYPVYDEEPLDYSENRFRRNVLINTGALMRMEPTPIIRPASEAYQDQEAARAAEGAWDVIQDHIQYEQVKALKAFYKVLYGNCFNYSDYQIDRRFGVLMVPKFKFEALEMPGMSTCGQCGQIGAEGTMLCPDCGFPMEQVPPMTTESKVQAGFEEKIRGQEFTAVCSPLEVKGRAKVKGGLRNQPFLLWPSMEDIDAVKFVYPKLDIKPMSSEHGSGDMDSSLRYVRNLAALPGNISGEAANGWMATDYYEQVNVCRAWIRPQLFRGDKELLKQCPDGLMAVMVGDQVVEWRAESIDDHWTHEIYLPNPESFYGDGMVDNVPIQRMLNKINQLQVQRLEYDTVPLRLYDVDMVVKEDITNDPSKKWIAANTSPEKGLDAAVRDLNAQTLSMDVQAFKAQVYQADQDVSGATDPLGGNIAGANTPYSAYVFAAEQGQVRFLTSMKYNAGAVQDHVRQLLKIAQTNWVDARQREQIDQNLGKSTWSSFTGADLAQGSWVVKILSNDFKPKTRAEMMYGMEYLIKFGVDVMSSPKMRLDFFEKVGITPDGDMQSTQARRAYRQIEKMKVGDVQPDPLIDDGMIQAPIIQEYLASQQGEQLMETNPEAYQRCVNYLQLVLQMTAMRNMAMAGMGMPGMLGPMPSGGGPQQGGTPAGDGGGGGMPKPPTQEFGQAPIPDSQKQPLPAMPQGVR